MGLYEDEAFIEALPSSELAPTRERVFTVAPSGAQHIWYAYPVSYGVGVFKHKGVEGGFYITKTINVTNPFGQTTAYYLYESTCVNLGPDTEIEVT